MSIWHRLQQFLARGIFKGTHSSKNGALQLESLEARSLLASHPLVDAPDVDYVVTDQWSTGHTADVTITNDEGSSFTNWTLEFETSGEIGNLWNAEVTNLGNGRYAITPPSWDNTLDAGESISFGFTATGPSGISNVSFSANGQSTPAPAPPAETPVAPPANDPIAPPVDTDPAAPVASELNYAEALQKSFLFYEANRSGDLDEDTKRIDWRQDSTLTDGFDGIYFGDRTDANLQQGLAFDLTGGYFDAGDHGKFGLPLASTLTTLSWGGIEHAEGYAASGQSDELLEAVRWGTDYLLKAHVTDADGNTEFFVVQVGDVSADHALWSAPESQSIDRPAMAITPDKPGSDVAAQSAAAMASASILFRNAGDTAYADILLANAEALFDFADTYRGKYSDSVTEVRGYYASWSGYYEDLAVGAAWLARANEAAGSSGDAYRNQALNFYRNDVGGLNNGWTHNWDDASYAAAVILAQDTGDAAIRQDVEGWLNTWVNGGEGVSITDGGLRFISQWGSLRYAANTSLLAGIYADNVNDPDGAYSDLAQGTVDYILGNNPVGISYIVGYGDSYPQQPHHRAASGVGWDGFRNGQPNKNILYGALVGGPSAADDYSYNDSRDDYISNEVAIDYNAGITGALARSAGRLGGSPLTSTQLDALPGISDPAAGQTPSQPVAPQPEPELPPNDPVTPPVNSDPEQLPVISISDAQVIEGDSGFVLATFSVMLSKASSEEVTVGFHTMTNTASSGYDFERAEGTVSFAPGETSQTIDVRVLGDVAVEANERFEVMLMSPSGAVFDGSTSNDTYTPAPAVPGEPLNVPTSGTFGYFTSQDGSLVMDLTTTGAHSTQLMVNSSGNLIVLGPFNGQAIQQHEVPLNELIANTSAEFLEIRTPDPEEDPNQMIGTWMQDPIGGLQISNAHLYADAAGLFLGEKLGIVGGQSSEGYVVTSHRMDDSGVPLVHVIDGFNPVNDKLDFQYFANREFAVADSPDGVVISASPQATDAWGEKTVVRGITFDQLTEDNFIFRFEQKYEDGFNRFGGTSESTPTNGSRDVPFISSLLGNDENHAGMPHGDQGSGNMSAGVLSAFGTIIDDDEPEVSIPPVDESPAQPPSNPVTPPANPSDPPASGGTVVVSDIEIVEGDSGTSQAVFTVTRSSADTPLAVSYTTEDGAALAGQDYLADSGTLNFAAGQTSAQVAVTILGDTQFEADETFTLRVQSIESENTPIESPEAPQSQVEQPVIAAYYPEWGIYGRNYQIADVPGEDLTHFIYAFANLTPQGEMVLFDSYAATEKRFTAAESVSGEADLWDYPADDPRSQQTVWGNFNQVAQLKAKYPHLRTSIAIGGWTLSGNFSDVSSTAAGRETLAQSIYDFLDTYTMFDGIDFDWEYPGGGGLSSNGESPQDGANYASLLESVRGKLDQLGAENDRYYEITVASPGGSDKIANFNVAGVNEHVDFFNVMTYDFHGTWENSTGHQAALTNDPAGYDIQTAINLYLDAGVPEEKLILGAPAYTRAWSGVADGGDNGYREGASGAAPGTFEAGNYDYKDLASQYLAGSGDWELNWDDDAQAAYLYSQSQNIFSSFETPGTISLKSEWAQDLGLGGMMFWDLSNDLSGNESLIGAAADSWFAGKTFNEITGASDLVFDNIYGGNGIFDLVAEADTTPSLPQIPNGGSAGEPIDVSATGTIVNDDPVTPPVDTTPVAPPVEETPVTPPVDETPETPPVIDPSAPAQIIDNGSDGFSQTGFRYMSNASVSAAMDGDVHMLRRGSGEATWQFTGLEDGEYNIATTWAGKYGNKYNATDAPYVIRDAAGSILTQTTVDQTATPADFDDAGKGWHTIGTVTVTGGTISVSVSEGANSNRAVIADAVRIQRVSADAPVTPVTPPVDTTPVAPPVEETPVTPPVDETPETPPVIDPSAPAQIIDNGSDGFSQTGFRYMSNASVSAAMDGDVHMLRRGSGEATWQFTGLEDGEYNIATTWAGKYGNKYNATDAPYVIRDAAGSILTQTTVDQTATPADFDDAGKGWHTIGTVTVTGGTISVSVSEGANSNRAVIADAVRIQRVSADAPVTPVTPPVDTTPVAPPVEETPVTPPVDETPAAAPSYEVVAATTSVSVLVDPETGLAYLQEEGSDPVAITRADDYWEGDVPLTRGDATILAAARDAQGRLRVLDGGGTDVYAWILNNDGLFIGEEGPSATSISAKEVLFQYDIDGNGTIGEVAPPVEETPVAPPVEETPAMPPMEDHSDHDGHDHMAPPADSGDYIDITSWGTFHGSNHNSEHDELVGGRTAITTEAMVAYNNLRAFLGFAEVSIEEVGQWAFDESLTNNSTAWGNDLLGVGLWYAMQGAKVGWIADEAYDPQILADIQRTARTVQDPVEMQAAVMDMVRQFGHDGFADYLEQYDIVDTFINTLKMEPHYGGWMHGRTHGFRSIEGVAINHDINHLTVLSWDQMQPFMNDTFDWPQWPALDVSDSGVIEYFQSMVSLGNPVGQNLESAPAPVAPPVDNTPVTPPVEETPATPPMEDHSDHDHGDHDHGDMTPPVEETPVAPPVEETPAMPPMEDHSDHDGHDHMAPPADSGDYIDITSWGTFHGSNHNSEHDELVGGRTAITTEAMVAYNNLRAFLGFAEVSIEEVGQWAFDESLTNNSTAWGNDLLGVGLWYAMQGAKVGWIADEAYDPQILADIQRTARTVQDPVEMQAAVMDMVRQFGHDGFADYLEQYDIVDTFINTLKMEPHYGGWMHGRTHGFRSIEGVAINHDINHLTVLSWDQMQPFMNDTFDWPQWPALDVSDSGVIEYFQSMVSLGNPVGQNLESAPAPVAPPVDNTPVTPPVEETPATPPMEDHSDHDHGDHDHGDMTPPVEETPVAPPVEETPAMPPMEDHSDHDGHDHMAPPADSGDYIDITSWGTFHGSNHNSEHDELVGGRTAITTEAMVAYNNLRAFLGFAEVSIEEVGQWAFDESLTNNSTAWGNDLLGVGLWYAMQGAKVGWIADEAYDPQILADIQRTARTVQDPVEMQAAVMDMVRQFGHDGFADYLEQYDIVDTFINTLKMEPHYGGWMHGRTHGFRSIEGVAINHDINHLTVLSWDQMQPFMNDTFDWPQWPALDVSDSGVIEYFQSMVSLGNPVGQNLESAPAPVAPPVDNTPVTPPVDNTPVAPPVDNTPVNPGGEPTVSLDVTYEWEGGFNGDLTVVNNSSQSFDGWMLEFTYAGQIDYIWNASVVSQDGDRYVITNEDWNAQVAAGDDVTFGFTITGSQDVLPSEILFYGKDA